MKAMAKHRRLNQHVLVSALVVLTNLTLGLSVYLLHEWYSVSFTLNPVLLQAYNFSDGAGGSVYASNRMAWGQFFSCLLLLQAVCLKVNKLAILALLIAVSLMALLMWFYIY